MEIFKYLRKEIYNDNLIEIVKESLIVGSKLFFYKLDE